jgi:phosphatidylglycerophosphate synthase
MQVPRWRAPDPPLRGSAGVALAVGVAATGGASFAIGALFELSWRYPWLATGLFTGAMAAALGWLSHAHPFARFGPANQVTTLRAMLVALLTALIGEPQTEGTAALAAFVGLLAAALDGVDGRLARRSGLASDFGARFDMEIDALLIVALSALAWKYEKAGAWVLGSGLLRYAFVAAGGLWPWLRHPLPPSRRRQAGCVIQTLVLGAVLLPAVPTWPAGLLAAGGLLILALSFAIDIVWLARRAGKEPGRWALGRWVGLAASLLLLNASLTFQNVWPTPAIYWNGELSIELAGCLLALTLAAIWYWTPSRRALRWMAIGWLAMVVGRYAEVTSLALYGREVNLYWDLRYIPDVAAMLARVDPMWVAAVAAAGAVLFAVYAVLRWALGRVVAAMARPAERRILSLLATTAVVLFALERPDTPNEYREYRFAPAVIPTYLRQVSLAMHSLAGSSSIAPSPPMDSDLELVKDADVFLMFVESYGAVTYDRPEFAEGLAPARAELERAVLESGRDVVSAFVESPTFGGASWLAHISLMSGVEVRDPDTNARLMTEKRDTIATTFRRQGYRTVALMPGLWRRWPEGEFYRFDELYDGPRLDYHGPEIGWWNMSDQFALARLDALEVARESRAPLFVFFPTISTHTPFAPTPPYQPDWKRILGDNPYDEPDVQRIYTEAPDWLNLGPSYVSAVAYVHRSIAGYLRLRADRDFVFIIVGDHQPPAMVSGAGAPWDVPVHVVASRKPVIDRLLERGFRRGLTPDRSPIAPMHALLPVLLGAFGSYDSSELIGAR